jgi:hypothetical protein
MHNIEPYYHWRHLYTAEQDSGSPFLNKVYNEFEYENTCFDHLIHPQWDDIGSIALYVKILYVDYETSFCVIELLGEWNDAIENDIMNLKREVVEVLNGNGINKFLFIAENLLNFHADDDSYYQEWFDEIEDGWIAFIGLRDHIMDELDAYDLDYYLSYGESFNSIEWRKFHPDKLFLQVSTYFDKLEIGVK